MGRSVLVGRFEEKKASKKGVASTSKKASESQKEKEEKGVASILIVNNFSH